MRFRIHFSNDNQPWVAEPYWLPLNDFERLNHDFRSHQAQIINKPQSVYHVRLDDGIEVDAPIPIAFITNIERLPPLQ
jgi:hypothetical protein